MFVIYLLIIFTKVDILNDGLQMKFFYDLMIRKSFFSSLSLFSAYI